MTQHDDHFVEFQAHTRLKHAILDSYVVAWAMKLLNWHRAGESLAIVDAFAGAGKDKAGNEGSPLIVVRRSIQAMAAFRKAKPGSNPAIAVYAIEKDPAHFRALTGVLAPFARPHPGLVHPLRGELVDHIDRIQADVGDAPTFYFLDPFGIKGLDANTYPKALAGPHNEVFALFADLGAVRLHGLTTAPRADASNAVHAILAAPSLFPEDDARLIEAAIAAVNRTNDALEASSPASRKLLTRALGSDDWVDEVELARAEDRADVFLGLFQRALVRAGARYVLAIPMRNDDGHRVYALVHASKSEAGFVTMKECVSSGLRNAEMNEDARKRIIEDISIDLDAIVVGLQREFAGCKVPWAAENGIKAFALANSAMFHLQANDLKGRLKDAGILRTVNRKLLCTFPEGST